MTNKTFRANKAGRELWLNDLFRAIGEKLTAGEEPTLDDYTAILDRILSEGPSMGRSEKWHGALAWIESFKSDAYTDPDWVVRQGSIYLGYAA